MISIATGHKTQRLWSPLPPPLQNPMSPNSQQTSLWNPTWNPNVNPAMKPSEAKVVTVTVIFLVLFYQFVMILLGGWIGLFMFPRKKMCGSFSFFKFRIANMFCLLVLGHDFFFWKMILNWGWSCVAVSQKISI